MAGKAVVGLFIEIMQINFHSFLGFSLLLFFMVACQNGNREDLHPSSTPVNLSPIQQKKTMTWTLTATLSPKPDEIATLTAEQQYILDELKHRHDCDLSCLATRQANDSYAEYGTPQKITRPEWKSLFPKTQFYIAPWIDHYKGEAKKQNTLFALQGEQQYEVKTYDRLLEANSIVITDGNRELVAKVWALMTIPEFLSEDVKFTSWVLNQDPRYADLDVYDLTGWAKLGGVELTWTIAFRHREYKLVTLGPDITQTGVGNFIEIPDGVPIPQKNAFYFFPVR